MMDLENFKTFFPVYAKRDLEKINKRQIKNWIQNNMSRIEFKISSKESSIALNLLEALVQFNFPPIYEGKQ
jgi:preprotein translocase subunit Sec63